LGVEPKGEGIQGRSGFSVPGESKEVTPASAPKTPESAPVADPKATQPKTKTATDGSQVSSTPVVDGPLPVARSLPLDLIFYSAVKAP